MRDIYVANADEALATCTSLVRSGQADLFRGQTHDWPKLLPSFFRPQSDPLLAASKLNEFLEWGRNVPQMMAPYRGSETALTAIAQHYGIPTRFLDLSTSPEVALLFAKPIEKVLTDETTSVIYCFCERLLIQLPGVKTVRIDVGNLWRLESQQGLFLEFLGDNVTENIRDLAIRVHFGADRLTPDEKLFLYPLRKSALESVIDQWIYRQNITIALSSLDQIPVKQSVHRRTYPGVFRWRMAPEYEPGWIMHNPAWFMSTFESARIISDQVEIVVPCFDMTSPMASLQFLVNVLAKPMRQCLVGQRLMHFKVELSSSKQHLAQSIEILLNRCWDGLRVLPFLFDEIISSMTLTTALLCARAEGVEDVSDWPNVLWGDVEIIEVAPVGGFIEAGRVSSASLRQAYSSRHHSNLTGWMRRHIGKDFRSLMTYVVDPWILFEFEPFKKLFAEQFLPTAVDGFWNEDLELCDGALECMWSVCFNPALLGYVTNTDFRFYSPVAMESEIEQIVMVETDMDRSDLEELFVSCLPSILNGGKPYQVKFNGYSRDPRELWQIDKVMEQAQWIVEVSGLSVLEGLPGFDQTGSAVDRPVPRGLGAFDIWLLSRGQLQEVNHYEPERQRLLLEEFFSVWVGSNEGLELRADTMTDWPVEKRGSKNT